MTSKQVIEQSELIRSTEDIVTRIMTAHWDLASFGMQTLPSNPPSDVCTSFIVEAHEWKPTIREALEAYHQSQIKFRKSRKSRPRKRRKRQ